MSVALKLTERLLERLALAREQRHTPAALGQRLRSRATDPLRSTGDKRPTRLAQGATASRICAYGPSA